MNQLSLFPISYFLGISNMWLLVPFTFQAGCLAEEQRHLVTSADSGRWLPAGLSILKMLSGSLHHVRVVCLSCIGILRRILTLVMITVACPLNLSRLRCTI